MKGSLWSFILITVTVTVIRWGNSIQHQKLFQRTTSSDDKEAGNRLKMALSHNAMIHAPLMALQGSGHVRARRSPMAPTIVINGGEIPQKWVTGVITPKKDPINGLTLVFQSYLVRIGVWIPKHLLNPEPFGVPNTDPHKLFGGFWKTRVIKPYLPLLVAPPCKIGWSSLRSVGEPISSTPPKIGGGVLYNVRWLVITHWSGRCSTESNNKGTTCPTKMDELPKDYLKV